ncbi:MAG: efflux RND transporter periplasmic adaptor subunit [Lachnospiraceae bacterium]|nr:efflux RND transporter periplasmic adaptor subunit [Lachnospiraceae bacterium]
MKIRFKNFLKRIVSFIKGHPRKALLVGIAVFVILVLLAALLIYNIVKKSEGGSFFPQEQRGMGITVTEDMVMASGVINVGTVEENFEVENLSTSLEIEEIYVMSGTELAQGDKILKVTDESIEEARKELEEAEEKLNDALEELEEYMSYVLDESYSSYFSVDEYQELYDENLELLEELMEEWGYSWTQVVGGGSGGSSKTSSTVSDGDADSQNDYSDSSYSTLLSSLYKILESNLNDLEDAESDYKDALLNAKYELQALQLEMPGLEQAVTEAKENIETKQLEAKLTYETSLSNAESAESDYETAIEKAEADYETLKGTWEDAEENLELFESSLGDGYFYASESGTVIRTMVRSGGSLTPDSTVIMYSNPSEMTVTVTVDQADISKVAVGDNAYVAATTGESAQGVVTSINPISYSSSRANVTYEVTVVLNEDTESLTANQSVTVILGLSDEEISQLEGTQGREQNDMQGNDGMENGADGSGMMENGAVIDDRGEAQMPTGMDENSDDMRQHGEMGERSETNGGNEN